MPDPEELRAQYEQAERLVREAHRAAEEAATRTVPPRGWSVPGEEPRPNAFPDLAALTELLESMRGVIPPELARQLADALRDLLIAIRAVLDWYIARLEPPERQAPEVQDIPVD